MSNRMDPSARLTWEARLRLGDPVIVHWGYGSGFRAHGPSKIVKINRCTYSVRLTAEVPAPFGCRPWPAGTIIAGIPHATAPSWHPDYAIYPVTAEETTP